MMDKYSNATLNSGFVIGVLRGIANISKGMISHPQDFISIFVGGILVFGYLWVIGLVFTAILLILLRPVFRKTSSVFSCLVFLFIGIIIPMFFQYKLNQFSAHGIDPYSTENILHSINMIILMSAIGAAGAFSAWFTLFKEKAG